MSLSRDQKKFAYGRYVFYDTIKSILDFMDPVSKLDVKIEEVKKGSGYIEFLIFFILAILIVLLAIFKNYIAKYLQIDPNIIQSQVIPSTITVFIISFVAYGLYYYNHINSDVDNDLNNFIIPFLQKIKKYIKEDQPIKLETDLGSKLSRKNKIDSGTYADCLAMPWFSVELPLDNNIKAFINLTYIINCYGKLNIVHSADGFKDLKMKIELKFVFPKTQSFKKFDYIGANYILDWSEYNNEYILNIKTVEDCKIEFYRDFDRKLGLIFDNNVCMEIIDDIYARITGFTGYLENQSEEEEKIEEQEEEIYDDYYYEELENLKKKNQDFYKVSNSNTSIIDSAESIIEIAKEREEVKEKEKDNISDLEKLIESKSVTETPSQS